MAEKQQTVLEVKGLKKRIHKKWIIEDVSFEVKAGEVFGFLGPNGAGKTTTIRMLVDLIRPTQGSVRVCGVDVHRHRNEALRHIGCIVENPEMYDYLSGMENLEQYARMLPGVDTDRIEEVIRIAVMEEAIHQKVGTYSLGMKQRLGIAQALLGRPDLLILDEPTNGLDPQGIKDMRRFIRDLARTGLSVFVSSHLLSEIQQMCDSVAIIRRGNVIASGTVEELLKQVEQRVEWILSPAQQAAQVLVSWEGSRIVSQHPIAATLFSESGSGPSERIRDLARFVVAMAPRELAARNEQLMQQHIWIHSASIIKPTLEELFLRLTEGETID